ncbi:MAG: alpha/beta hydrolase [Betaproteobacteria bacterium]|nr:alpha/beta hydrolase [Betaproteobacteria bacterium]MDH5578426.1 alpha/beta hydrolase [Betaproteobacteria bacterium]
MAHITTKDGVKLHYEEAGKGTPVVFVHEFAGDLRSWDPQLAHFSRRYRCIAYNARGYPPSDVPESWERYSQEFARDDVLAVLDGLKLERAFVVGLSMGGFAALHFGIKYSPRALGLVVAGCGYGAEPARREEFLRSSRANAEQIMKEGMANFAATYGHNATRLQLRDKDPRGFALYIKYLSEHSAQGSANTMLGYQARRPSLYDLKKEMAGITAPTLVMCGDEDDATLEPGLLMKRTIPRMGLVVLPRTGHGMNLEDPALFNRIVEDFFHQVESGRWA